MSVPQMVNAELRILFRNAQKLLGNCLEIASIDEYPNKVYVGISEDDFKQCLYSRRMLCNNEGLSTDTALSKYLWEIKQKFKTIPSPKQSVIKSVSVYSKMSKKYQLCLQEKLGIPLYLNQSELLNERSELIQTCRHVNKPLFSNYKSKSYTL